MFQSTPFNFFNIKYDSVYGSEIMNSNNIPFNDCSFSIGEALDVRDSQHNWYLAQVIATCKHRIKIHYNQYPSQYDEWIPDSQYNQRLAAANTYSITYTELSARQYFSDNLSPTYYVSKVDNKEYIVWIEFESLFKFTITLQDIKTNQFTSILTHSPNCKSIHNDIKTKQFTSILRAAFMNANCDTLYIQGTDHFIVIDLDKQSINPKVQFPNNQHSTLKKTPKICNVNNQMHCIYPKRYTYNPNGTNVYTVMQMNNSLNMFTTIMSGEIVTDNVSYAGRHCRNSINILYDKLENRILLITESGIYGLHLNCDKNIWKHLLTLQPTQYRFRVHNVILAFDVLLFLFYGARIHCIDLVKQKEFISKKKIPIKFDDVVKTRDNFIHFFSNKKHKHIRVRLCDLIPTMITDEYAKNELLKSQHFPHLKKLVFGYMKEQETKINVQITGDVQQIIWLFFPIFC
eukprot:525648_1